MGEHREQRVGLVVRMRRSLHKRAGNAKLANRKAQHDVAAVLANDRVVHSVLRQNHNHSKKDREQFFHSGSVDPFYA